MMLSDPYDANLLRPVALKAMPDSDTNLTKTFGRNKMFFCCLLN